MILGLAVLFRGFCFEDYAFRFLGFLRKSIFYVTYCSFSFGCADGFVTSHDFDFTLRFAKTRNMCLLCIH